MPIKQLLKLEEMAAGIDFKKECAEAPHVLQRCEAIWSNYEKLIDGLRKVAPAVEQLKGISSGLRGATEIAGNFKVMIKTEYEKEEISKELAALKISLVDDIQKALKDGADKQREDFIKAAGKSEGLYTAAVMSLDQIKNYLYTLRNQNEFIEKNPSLFDLEAKPPPPSRAEVAELVEKADKAKKDAALNQEVARIHKARQTTTSAPQPPANRPQPTQQTEESPPKQAAESPPIEPAQQEGPSEGNGKSKKTKQEAKASKAKTAGKRKTKKAPKAGAKPN